jgi:hypothetical protein
MEKVRALRGASRRSLGLGAGQLKATVPSFVTTTKRYRVLPVLCGTYLTLRFRCTCNAESQFLANGRKFLILRATNLCKQGSPVRSRSRPPINSTVLQNRISGGRSNAFGLACSVLCWTARQSLCDGSLNPAQQPSLDGGFRGVGQKSVWVGTGTVSRRLQAKPGIVE